ncbi:MAG: hypothetical protein JST54_28825 [Deltaproteobacteria bacterium]|nr:hypothetical protein [Deltaproteobacteria bacterium]
MPSASPAPRLSDRTYLALAALLLGALVLLAYENAWHVGFLRDAAYILGKDPRIGSATWENVRLAFAQGYWWPSFQADLYRPATTLSFMLDGALLGHVDAPEGHHAVNLALHFANALLVLLIARRLMPDSRGVALIAAAIFAAHPLATEAVTYLVGRSDELAALGILAGLLFHLRGSRVGVLLASTLAAFSKESGVLLVAVLLLHDALISRRANLASWLAAAIPAIGFVIARLVALRDSPFFGWPFVDNPLVAATPVQTVLTASKVFLHGLGLAIFPRALSVDYSYDAIPVFGAGGVEDALCVIGLIVAIALVVGALLLKKRAPIPAFATLLFLGLLVPTSSVLFPIGAIFAERFLYLPLAAFALAAAWTLEHLTRLHVRAPVAIAAALTLAFAIRTHARNDDWHDELSLYRSAAEATPNSFKVHRVLAGLYWNRGPSEENADAAIAEGNRALAILEARPLSLDQRDGWLELELGSYERAKGEYRRAAHDEPAALTHLQRSLTLLERAAEVDAFGAQRAREQKLAHGAKPDEVRATANPRVQLALFETDMDLQKLPEADQAATAARAAIPLSPEPYVAAARLDLAQEDLDGAAVELVQALILDRQSQAAWGPLHSVYAALGHEEAITSASQGPTLDPKNPLVRHHLDRACNDLVKQLSAAHELESARVVYDRCVEEFACAKEQLGARPQ